MTEETPSEEVSEAPEVPEQEQIEETIETVDSAEVSDVSEVSDTDDADDANERPTYTPLRISRESLPRWRGQIRRFLKLSEAQVALGWAIILVVGTLIGTIYLAQASRVAEVGRRVQILQNELADLKRENGQMERQIAEAQTLEYMQVRAEQLGFVVADPEDIDYIVVQDYPAEVVAVEVFEPTPAPTAVPIETFREALQLEIDRFVDGLTSGTSDE